MCSLRSLSERHFRTGNTKLVERITELREQVINELSKMPRIHVSEIKELDRIGRFTVAQSLFQKCDRDARHYLLHDEHAHVCAAAAKSNNLLSEKE